MARLYRTDSAADWKEWDKLTDLQQRLLHGKWMGELSAAQQRKLGSLAASARNYCRGDGAKGVPRNTGDTVVNVLTELHRLEPPGTTHEQIMRKYFIPDSDLAQR